MAAGSPAPAAAAASVITWSGWLTGLFKMKLDDTMLDLRTGGKAAATSPDFAVVIARVAVLTGFCAVLIKLFLTGTESFRYAATERTIAAKARTSAIR